ncbi:MAG: c-type cytochrome [Deltaproteobacteria bacterium]|nr:c-type cytochrome [Deltaproteobacteria bacterium]
MRRTFLILAILDLLIVAWAFCDELETRRPWKAIQASWNEVLSARGRPKAPIAIRQVTNPALGLIDRCQTCHLAAVEDGFGKELPVHLRSHPRRRELLGPHAPKVFACTTCHQGQGPQTKGVARSAFAHGADDPYWEKPLLTGARTESTCLDCHEEVPSGAPTLARGRRLFEELGCHGCHAIKNLDPPPERAAPSLSLVREKMSRTFFEEWVRDPRAIRRDSRMPSFWPPALVPQTGTAAPEGSARHARWRREREDEPKAIAAYLASIPSPRTLPLPAFDVSDSTLISDGRELFDRVGCRGCHRLAKDEPLPGKESLAIPPELSFGPSLEAVGEKATAAWLDAWLRNPRGTWPEARMPNLRLSTSEVERLVAFLVSLRRPGQPAANSDWSASDPSLVAAGRAAIVRLGCVGCHEIPGIDTRGRPGPELESFGDKTPDELTFGDALVDCASRSSTTSQARRASKAASGHGVSLECFARAKVRTPRLLEGRDVSTLVMPDFGLDESEVEALTVFLLSSRDRRVPPTYRPVLSPEARANASGERLIERLNCRGCHEIGRTRRIDENGEVAYDPIGGHIRRFEAEAALSPPALTFAGQKFQYAWLWDFLREPTTVRPYLQVRMPTFALRDSEIDALSRAFAARDGEPYPVQQAAVPKLRDEEKDEATRFFGALKCRNCHPSRTGPQSMVSASPADLAPDLALAPRRLKPRWLRAWLEDPQALQADTRMPSYFPADEEQDPPTREGLPGFFGDDAQRQIDALVALVLEPAS